MTSLELSPEIYRPKPPPAAITQRYGIGIVGCGSIVRLAHLPAYRSFGYRVIAACDVVAANAEQTAGEFAIPYWTTNLDELLADDAIQIIDLAVHAAHRPPLVAKIAAAGKHILSQKPFALTLSEAITMVQTCQDAGVTLMINQQARWAPAHQAIKRLLERGTIGHLYSVLHINRSFQDIPGSWYVAMEHFNILDHGVHYLDLARFFTGQMPLRIKATTTTVPEQRAVTPMIYSIQYEYAPEAQLMATLHFNNIVQGTALQRNEWLLDGTHGSLVASQNELSVALRDQPGEKWSIALQGSWFPEAFGGAMGELMTALAEQRPPQTSGIDNLHSLLIAYAAVASSQTGQVVTIDPSLLAPVA
jgi:predicted dehydrogenase